MRIVVHREIPEDGQLRSAWNALVQKMDRPEVFYTYEWALAVYRAYRERLKPLLMLAYEEESLLGIASLATDVNQEKAVFLAHATADYCDFVSHPNSRGPLVEAVFAELRRLELPTLTLANFPADSATFRVLAALARKNGYSLFSRPAYLCAQVSFPSTVTREHIAKTVRSKQMLRRNLKVMAKTGPIVVSHFRSWNDIRDVLPQFTRAHVARFLATGRISSQAHPEKRLFLAELARLLSESGWLSLSCLTAGDHRVAWNYGFRYGGSWFWYQPCFDTRFQQNSPGLCLLAKIIEEACADPETNLVDMGLGAEEYKERFATGGRQTLHVTATTSTAVRHRRIARYYAAEAVKSLPRLEPSIRNLSNHFSSMRGRIATGGLLAAMRSLAHRCKNELTGKAEIHFFEWREREHPDTGPSDSEALSLQPVDLDLLATAAMNYVHDMGTTAYLLRAAERLRSSVSHGFALTGPDGVPVHLCWVEDFAGFYMSELDHTLTAPSANSVLLFDCWTPAPVRGHSYYGMAISQLAAQLRMAGSAPWIFSAVTNTSSLRGIEKAGFVREFSLIRKRTKFVSRLLHSQCSIAVQRIAGVSSVG